MKLWISWLVFVGISVSASAESITVGAPGDWLRIGRNRFGHCDFKDAAHAFSKALQNRPQDAELYYWLGKSYARMAEVASPLHAARDARKARVSLERAVELEPRNREYLRELYDLCLNSPEYVSGGLSKAAALIERIEPDDPGAAVLLRELLAEVQQEYRGPAWRIRQATLLPSAGIGQVIP
jgi:Flp pilus assembly protein TadD